MKKKVFGTTERAASNANCMSGCSHNCHYCYAKTMAIRFHRKSPETWKIEEPRPIRKIGKRIGRIMFPTTHDISLTNCDYCFDYLDIILQAGNEVLIVSKPHIQVIEKLCSRYFKYKDKILLRLTIGSASNKTLALWEPGAPDFTERFKALKFAYASSFKTSISCEPMLDTDMSTLIESVRPYVTDCIWLGIMNSPFTRLKINGAPKEIIEEAKKLVKHYGRKTIKELYAKYRYDPLIKWKESIKKVVGIEVPTTKGLDI
jgi:DNA repair photolyase